jgi:hypothetical protein
VSTRQRPLMLHRQRRVPSPATSGVRSVRTPSRRCGPRRQCDRRGSQRADDTTDHVAVHVTATTTPRPRHQMTTSRIAAVGGQPSS